MRRLAGRVRPVDGVRSGNPSRESRWSMATGTLWSSETLLRDERSSRKAVSVVSRGPRSHSGAHGARKAGEARHLRRQTPLIQRD